MVRLPWLQQSPALGQCLPGQSPRTPPPTPVLTVQPGDSPGHGGAPCPPESRGSVPGRVCLSTKAQMGPTWPRVSEGAPRLGKGWPQRSCPAGGGRCSRGSARPYLPGRAEGSWGPEAVSPMAAGGTWPETPASGSSVSSQRRESPAGPSESGAGLCFLRFLRLQLLNVKSGSGGRKEERNRLCKSSAATQTSATGTGSLCARSTPSPAGDPGETPEAGDPPAREKGLQNVPRAVLAQE